MAKKPYRGRSGLYDTPTDGISKKVFDRYKDQQVRRHVQTMEAIRLLEKAVHRLQLGLEGLQEEEE